MSDSRNSSVCVKLVFVFLLLLFLLVILIIVVVLFEKTTDSRFDDIYTYPIYEYDPVTNYTMKGSVRMNRKLNDGENIAYATKRNNVVTIISDFLSVEYECSGECLCGNQVYPINFDPSQSVAAVSSIIAVGMAKDVLEDVCFRQFDVKCLKDNLEANIKECREREKREGDKKEKRGFFCQGRCEANNFDEVEMDERGKILAKEYACSSFELTQQIETYGDTENWDIIVKDDFDTLVAMKEFKEFHLNPYCKRLSKLPLDIGQFKGERISACHGHGFSECVPDKNMSPGYYGFEDNIDIDEIMKE